MRTAPAVGRTQRGTSSLQRWQVGESSDVHGRSVANSPPPGFRSCLALPRCTLASSPPRGCMRTLVLFIFFRSANASRLLCLILVSCAWYFSGPRSIGRAIYVGPGARLWREDHGGLLDRLWRAGPGCHVLLMLILLPPGLSASFISAAPGGVGRTVWCRASTRYWGRCFFAVLPACSTVPRGRHARILRVSLWFRRSTRQFVDYAPLLTLMSRITRESKP